jgi:ribosomal protein S18 acetylase RimI-like enzyme
MAATGPLHHFLWTALSGLQSDFSLGNHLVKRYWPSISPFIALREESPEAFAALESLADPEEDLILTGEHPLQLPEHWTEKGKGQLITMVLQQPLLYLKSHAGLRLLKSTDVPEMLALTDLTKPGPFRKDTILLGDYYGIFIEGRLAAMAGERMRIPGYTEISAVCTHPDFRGQGLARQVMQPVLQGILLRNEAVMLRVLTGNENAIRLYQNLGFEEVEHVHVIHFRTCPLNTPSSVLRLERNSLR